MIDNYKYPVGILLIFLGILFFLKQTGILPDGIADVLFDWRNVPIYAGAVFLFARNLRVALILFAIGALTHISNLIAWSKDYSQFVWPVIIIVVGIILLLSSKMSKK